MKILLTYSSQRGSTKKVAESIHSVLPQNTDMCRIDEVKCFDDYDLIVIGFWVHDFKPDPLSLSYISKIRNKKVALFATFGNPSMDYHEKTIENTKSLLENNEILGAFTCQGKSLYPDFDLIPKEVVEKVGKESFIRNYENNLTKPDTEDLINAKEYISNILKEYSRYN